MSALAAAAPVAEPLICFRNVTKSFGRRDEAGRLLQAIDNLDLDNLDLDLDILDLGLNPAN